MRRIRAIAPCLVAASLAGGLLAAPALGAPIGSKANPVKAKASKVKGFNPPVLRVKAGAVVWFRSVDGKFHNAQSRKLVKGKPVFSATVSNTTFSIRAPKAPGTYAYFCAVHSSIQKGRLIVHR